MRYTISFFQLVVFVALAGCSGPADIKIPESLSLAFEKVQLISGDEDARNEWGMRLSRQAARMGAVGEAMKSAGRVTGAKTGATFAMVAWDVANRGNPDGAKEAIRLYKADQWITTNDESGLKYAYLTGAFQRLGMDQEAEQMNRKIVSPSMQRLAISLRESAKISAGSNFRTFNKSKFTPDTILEAIGGLLPVLEAPQTGMEKKRELLGLLEEMTLFCDAPARVESWSKIAAVCGEYNLVGDAAILASRAIQIAQGFDPKVEMYAIGLSQTSMAFSAARDKAQAIHCLEMASVRPEIIALFYQPEAFSAIAKGYQKAGEPEKAMQNWLKATQITKSHPHPRARQINTVLILSDMADVSVIPSAEITAVMDSIGRGEGGDAPLPPGYVKVGDPKTNPVTAPARQDKKDKKKKESKVPTA